MKRIIGNALEIERGVFMHGCNAQGVMGSGVAKEVKTKFPSAFYAYREAYDTSGLKLGDVTIVRPLQHLFIVNAITQQYFGYDGRLYLDYKALETCANKAADLAKKEGLPLVFPLIGCDRGGGDWNVVRDMLDRVAQAYGVEAVLYTLDDKPLPGGPNPTSVQKIKP
jgi:O-acetyl-ADP-ribose deacetylase (regulator of RNase III)